MFRKVSGFFIYLLIFYAEKDYPIIVKENQEQNKKKAINRH